MDTHVYVYVYRIRNDDLPIATKSMNGDWKCFRSRVVKVLVGDHESLVIVETQGFYPYITNEWQKFIVAEEAMPTHVPSSD